MFLLCEHLKHSFLYEFRFTTKYPIQNLFYYTRVDYVNNCEDVSPSNLIILLYHKQFICKHNNKEQWNYSYYDMVKRGKERHL
jgi:hypothetical protein